jgi:hypothetical protein
MAGSLRLVCENAHLYPKWLKMKDEIVRSGPGWPSRRPGWQQSPVSFAWIGTKPRLND